MKETIAEATRRLLVDKKVKKLTVKDIVEECHITRQAFYYHFEGIGEMFRWIIKRITEQVTREMRAQENAEQGLRYFFLVAVNMIPYFKRGLQSNYRDELERLLSEAVYGFFEQAVETDGLYPSRTRAEVKVILRYHTQAVTGIMRSWTEEDTKNLDQIVHLIYLTMVGRLSPLE